MDLSNNLAVLGLGTKSYKSLTSVKFYQYKVSHFNLQHVWLRARIILNLQKCLITSAEAYYWVKSK